MYKEHENECIFTVTPYTHGRKNWGKKITNIGDAFGWGSYKITVF